TEDGNGSKNLAVTWNHQQDLTPNSHITTSVNYVTNTTLQRQNTFNPYAALATIASQAAYSSKAGPLTLNLGATRKQYPGRQQVEQTFPTLTSHRRRSASANSSAGRRASASIAATCCTSTSLGSAPK